jgi:hypothetical protein
MLEFINKYSLQKTIGFNLIPQGETLNFINSREFLERDEIRANSYIRVKVLLDNCHKDFIENILVNVMLYKLNEFNELHLIKFKTETERKELKKLKDEMLNSISSKFQKDSLYKILFKEELFSKHLPNFVETEEDQEHIDVFKKFQTYFTKYNTSRKNLYSNEDKSSTVASRIVNDNLPKFLDNLKNYTDIKKAYPDFDFKTIEEGLVEILKGNSLDDVFSIGFFNSVISQSGIDFYNTILGGRTEEDRVKIKGLNEAINLYKQANKLPNNKISHFKPLYKQILSDRISDSVIPMKFESDIELLESICNYYENIMCSFEDSGRKVNVFNEINDILKFSQYDTSKIFIQRSSFGNISTKLFGEYSAIDSALENYYTNVLVPIPAKPTKAYETKMNQWLKLKYYSIDQVHQAIEFYKTQVEEVADKGTILDYISSSDKLIEAVEATYPVVKELYMTHGNLNEGVKDSPEKVLAFMESIKELHNFTKPFLLKDDTDKIDKDEAFYVRFTTLMEVLDQSIVLYDKTRNYITKKPYSTEKLKVKFDIGDFLKGWSVDYKSKGAMFFIKDGKYYVGIVDKLFTDEDRNIINENPHENPITRIINDFQKPDFKNFPRIFIRSINKPERQQIAPAVEKYNLPVDEILEIYDKGLYKTKHRDINPVEYGESLTKMIEYYKQAIRRHESYCHYAFNWKESCEYNDISEFFKDSEESCYQLIEEVVSFDGLLKLVEQGKIYLFEIYGKDLSTHSKGTPNLHTIYFKMLFDQRNLNDIVYKINGGGEIYFRKKSLDYPEAIMREGHHAAKLKGKFKYPIIKDKRYTTDSFKLNISVTMNFKCPAKQNVDVDILAYLKANSDEVKIIGIDRGERNLLYVVLIDKDGKMLFQSSLNVIKTYSNGVEHSVNHNDKLSQKQKNRSEARKSWSVIEEIKKHKDAYMSDVVHFLSNMVLEHKAIVIMEELNIGFKRGRQKIDKQTYQSFEEKFIKKFQYLVLKDRPVDQPGGALKALQLTGSYEDFSKNKSLQSGILFCVPAQSTSKICPATGFVNFLRFNNYENIKNSQKYLSQFDSIQYNLEKEWFEFAFDYKKFGRDVDGSISKWTICTTPGSRYKWNKTTREYTAYDVTEQLRNIFDVCGINYASGEDIKNDILISDDAKLFKKLYEMLNLTLALRYMTEAEDFILSPIVRDGKYFNSLTPDNILMPLDSDANGAFHISLKGLLLLERLYKSDDTKNFNCKIGIYEYLKFVQDLALKRNVISIEVEESVSAGKCIELIST